jgi:ATP-dependent DNA helicase RecG
LTREPTGFAVLDQPEGWERPRLFPRPARLEAALDVLRGVGPQVSRKLERIGLRTVRDLLEHAPRRYEAAVPERRIADLLAEEEVAISGTVERVTVRRPRRRLAIVTARVVDESDTIPAIWFNQEWLAEKLVPGQHVRLRGQLKRGEFHVRSYDLDGVSATADYAPVYPASEELASATLRRLVEQALPHAVDVPDALPAAVRARERLPLRPDALTAIHRPRTPDEAEAGRRRLAFDELLVLQVGLARRRREREEQQAPEVPPAGALTARYLDGLPFSLTPHQRRAVEEIDADLARPMPMQRLLQGEVGSGKTVVALYALLRAVEAGRRGALMAPTETLAEQHFLTIEEMCRGLEVTCGLLTSSVPKRERQHAAGSSILVGTHALIQEGVDLEDVAVAVVDEQHRFGVEQREALVGGAGRAPHVLHMTATPIPRTLALTVYGDLAVSEISEPPAERKPVVTSWVTAERSSAAYTRLRRHLEAGRQAFVVCPLVSESETTEARAAEEEAARLVRAELAGFRVGCVHGKLRPAERRELMARFKARELDVLVATTVIEVGVDVPNATIMIVQEADRFGLAQLHQLRGRVGRGAEQSYCLLVSRPREQLTDVAQERLQALVDSTDGFELAERDLELRGAGELLGRRQSGLTDFRFARLRADRPLLERARAAAGELVDDDGPLADEVDRAFASSALAA